MNFPPAIAGLYEFIAKDGKVILQSNNIEVAELSFINLINDPQGVLRTRFKIIDHRGTKRVEFPVDIFIQEFRIQDFGLYVSGTDMIEKKSIVVNIRYNAWNRNWDINGMWYSKSINISAKSLGSAFSELLTKIS